MYSESFSNDNFNEYNVHQIISLRFISFYENPSIDDIVIFDDTNRWTRTAESCRITSRKFPVVT